MNIRRIILFLFVLLFTVPAVGQYMAQRKNRALVDFKQYKYGGWMISPGLTYMYPSRVKYLNDSTEKDDNVTLLNTQKILMSIQTEEFPFISKPVVTKYFMPEEESSTTWTIVLLIKD